MAIEQDEVMFDTDEVSAVEDNDSTLQSESSVVAFVNEKYSKAETSRYTDEQRWLKAYKNYRGLYGPDVQFTEAERSRVFIKVTKTKVLAAYGQITDVLFARQKFPLSIEPTTLPEGISEAVHFDSKKPPEQAEEQEEQSPYGFPGDGKDFEAGDTLSSLQDKKIKYE